MRNIRKALFNWELLSVTKAQSVITETPVFYQDNRNIEDTDYGLPLSEIQAIFNRQVKS